MKDYISTIILCALGILCILYLLSNAPKAEDTPYAKTMQYIQYIKQMDK